MSRQVRSIETRHSAAVARIARGIGHRSWLFACVWTIVVGAVLEPFSNRAAMARPPIQEAAPPGQNAASRHLDLAARAGAILNNYCFRCHRGEGSAAEGYAFNVRDAASMADLLMHDNHAAESDLYQAVFRNRMPPANQAGLPRPTAEEVEVLRQWIEAGAPEFPPIPRRPFIGLERMLADMFEHYQKLAPNQRGNYRYFTLTNLWNDPQVDERQLRLTRAALAKTLNSLSWKETLVLPEAIDADKTVFAIDITKLGWTTDHWRALVQLYPYQIDINSIVAEGNSDAVEQIQRHEEDMVRLGGGDRQLKHLRADWMITMGLRPELYHRLLYDLSLPELIQRPADSSNPANPKKMTDLDLESFLGVNVQDNIFGRTIKVSRAGFMESGISGQNRMIERHPLSGRGYYWKSYDFLGSNSRAILTEFPLGPQREPNDEFSFLHDGGEIIFSLPNGLQGYLLSTARGDRLDAGPIEIVGDALKTSGNQLIVNGLSCVACHRKGMVEPPDDVVRANAGIFGDEAQRIRELYPEPAAMQQLISRDSHAFQMALLPLFKPYLNEEDFSAFQDGFPIEPVGEVARWYLLQPMTIETVAAELFHEDIETLRLQIRTDLRARRLGLGQLRSEQGSIKRQAWQNIEGRSLMQQAAEVLGYAPGL